MQRGFLVSCPLLTLSTDRFSLGDSLQVEVRQVWGSTTDPPAAPTDTSLSQFDCAVTRAGTVVAHGVLNLYAGSHGEDGAPR